MQRGRPSTLISDRLRVMFWADSVLMASCVQSIKEMEHLLALRKNLGIRIASGLWARYLRGEVAPQGAKLRLKGNLVDRMDKVYPRTAEVFHHPVWRLLNWDPVIDMTEMRQSYLNLGDEVCLHFFAPSIDRGNRGYSSRTQFWHLAKTISERHRVFNELAIGPWQKIQLALMEAKMAYAAQRLEAFVDYQVMACRLIADLAEKVRADRRRIQAGLLMMEALALTGLRLCVACEPAPLTPKATLMIGRFNDLEANWRRRYFANQKSWPSWLRRSTEMEIRQCFALAPAQRKVAADGL
jgi:hypothetical protein